MLYTYRCPLCGWTGDRLAKIADRDNQICTQILQIEEVEPGAEECARFLDRDCGEKLIREEVSVTAALPYQWSQWTGKA